MAKQNLIPINSGVYVITNTANGKIYVGSSRHVRQRIRHHRRNLELGVHSSKRMIDDFLLFGWEVFEHEIVEPIHEPGVDLMAAEQRWIEKLRPYDPIIGYNLHPDAGGPRGYARPPETRERMRQAASDGS